MEATGGGGTAPGSATASCWAAATAAEEEDLAAMSERSLLKAEETVGLCCLRREEEDWEEGEGAAWQVLVQSESGFGALRPVRSASISVTRCPFLATTTALQFLTLCL